MTSEAHLAGHRPPQREPRPGEPIWTLRKGTESRRAELRDNGAAGVEFQLFAGDEFLYGQRFHSRAAALLLCEQERARREREGWAIA
jgi:hypothetical protein